MVYEATMTWSRLIVAKCGLSSLIPQIQNQRNTMSSPLRFFFIYSLFLAQRFAMGLQIPNPFDVGSQSNLLSSFGLLPIPMTKPSKESPVEKQKQALLEAVSYTGNGKTATSEQQSAVLEIVQRLETEFPPSPDLLTDTEEALQLLDGVWYLQYTSPSTVGDADRFPDAWKPRNAKEGDANVETNTFNAQGSISAAGIPVETANRVVFQNIDVKQSRVTNDIGLEWGRLIASGRFRPSPSVPNRALVSFDTFKFQFNNGFSIDVGFLFPILKTIRRSQENGWLETTFVDQDIRIGRGNKGTMFVLTRTQDAVQP